MNKTKGYIYLVLTFVIWGSLYVAAKSTMTEIPALAVLTTEKLTQSFIIGAVIICAGMLVAVTDTEKN